MGSPVMEIHNIAFEFWINFWSEVFKRNGVTERPNADDFLRQDLISVVMHDQRIVALHFYSFFDLNLSAARNHSYFKNSFTPKAMQAMDKHAARHVMTMEYFTVAPEWQRMAQGVSIAVSMVCLGLRIFTRSQADMFLGVSRCDVGVAKLGYEIGCLPLDTGIMLHGTPVDLQGCLRGHERYPIAGAENALAAELWNHRLELSPSVAENPFPLKKVA